MGGARRGLGFRGSWVAVQELFATHQEGHGHFLSRLRTPSNPNYPHYPWNHEFGGVLSACKNESQVFGISLFFLGMYVLVSLNSRAASAQKPALALCTLRWRLPATSQCSGDRWRLSYHIKGI